MSALTFYPIIIGLVIALVVWAWIMERRASRSLIEPNRGGPCRYQYGDLVQITYGGHLYTGEFKAIGPRIAGQPDILRSCSIRVEWIDANGHRTYSDIDMPYWRIRGKVRLPRKKAVVWDTGKYLAQERWLVRGPRKEHAR